MPVCLWECFECQKQFYIVANDPPKRCPHCLEIGQVHFVDNLEMDDWRPSEEEIEELE